MKILISLLLFLLSFVCKAQIDTNCNNLLNQVYENSCIQQDIDTLTAGNWITSCVPFQPIGNGNIHFSFILVNSNCGPLSPYNNLNLTIYNSTCDSLISDTVITPPNWDLFIHLDITQSYILCYRWKAKCTQWSWCPLISESALSVNWIYTRAIYSNDEKNISITWSTSSEINCNHFILQKYVQNEWKELWAITCSGTSTTINTYQITDEKPLKKNLYRVKQVDDNNNFIFSKLFQVDINSTDVPCSFFSIWGNRIDESKLISGDYIKVCGGKFTKIVIIK